MRPSGRRSHKAFSRLRFARPSSARSPDHFRGSKTRSPLIAYATASLRGRPPLRRFLRASAALASECALPPAAPRWRAIQAQRRFAHSILTRPKPPPAGPRIGIAALRRQKILSRYQRFIIFFDIFFLINQNRARVPIVMRHTILSPPAPATAEAASAAREGASHTIYTAFINPDDFFGLGPP